jgi:pyruvate ferredoxin oxidoreductase gamma subunit
VLNTTVFEIVIYGRGGQGAKIAGQLIVEAAMENGKQIQAFPEFGPERSGAPIRSFARISNKPIRTSQPVTEPDAILVMDSTLFQSIDVSSGSGEKTVMIVNSGEKGTEIKKVTGFGGKIYTLDATGISIKHLGRNLPNMPMLGALIKVTNVIEMESLIRKVRNAFLGKVGKDKTESNIAAIREAYEGVKNEG